MKDTLSVFVVAWIVTQAASFVSLELGARHTGNRHLMRIGELALRKKLQALDRVWPLTLIRSAVTRGDERTCTIILSALIALKSVASLVFGVIMVFWLPLVSVMVPSIVAVHDPDDPSLIPWVRRVAGLQVTSHALAAALGFALVVTGPLAGRPLLAVVGENTTLVLLASLLSLAFALASGKAEASGVVQRGI